MTIKQSVAGLSLVAGVGLAVMAGAAVYPSKAWAQDAASVYPDGSYALVIGNRNYAQGGRQLSATQDALAVADALEDRGFSVSFLRNLDRARMDAEITEFLASHGEKANARLVLWFSGRGVAGEGGSALLTVDAPADAAADDAGAVISMRDVASLVGKSKSKHILVVLDVALGDDFYQQQEEPRPPTFNLRTLSDPARIFIVAAEPGQQSPGLVSLSRSFVDALADPSVANPSEEDVLKGSELSAFLAKRIAAMSDGKQTARYGRLAEDMNSFGDFLFFTAPAETAVAASTTGAPEEPEATATAQLTKEEPSETSPPAQRAAVESSPPEQSAPAQRPAVELTPPTQKPAAQPKATRPAAPKPSPPAQKVAAKPAPKATPPRIEAVNLAMVAVRKSNVRAGPTVKSRRVGSVESGATVLVTGRVVGAKWYRIIHNGKEAFIYAGLVAEAGSANAKAAAAQPKPAARASQTAASGGPPGPPGPPGPSSTPTTGSAAQAAPVRASVASAPSAIAGVPLPMRNPRRQTTFASAQGVSEWESMDRTWVYNGPDVLTSRTGEFFVNAEPVEVVQVAGGGRWFQVVTRSGKTGYVRAQDIKPKGVYRRRAFSQDQGTYDPRRATD